MTADVGEQVKRFHVREILDFEIDWEAERESQGGPWVRRKMEDEDR